YPHGRPAGSAMAGEFGELGAAIYGFGPRRTFIRSDRATQPAMAAAWVSSRNRSSGRLCCTAQSDHPFGTGPDGSGRVNLGASAKRLDRAGLLDVSGCLALHRPLDLAELSRIGRLRGHPEQLWPGTVDRQ